MNCVECRDNLVAHTEGLLDPIESLDCKTHMASCAKCRAEYASITSLQRRLIDHGRGTANVSVIEPVMRRIQTTPPNTNRVTIMKKIFSGWGFPMSAAASVAVIVTMILVLSPSTQAKAAEVLAKGAQAVAKLSSIHLQCKVRTLPSDDFSFIAPDQDFSALDVWKQFGAGTKWRVEKPGRVATMDGQSSILYFKEGNIAVKDRASMNAFDTEWIQRIADLSETINQELQNAKTKGWKLDLAKERAPDGRMQSIVTIQATSSLPDGDYLKNQFIDLSDTRRAYRFDDQTGMLEGAQIYLTKATGDVLIFEVTHIECNQPINPNLFHLNLPENVTWSREWPLQAGDKKIITLTPEQAARTFFEAYSHEDWKEVSKFLNGMPLIESAQQRYGGLKVVSIGKAFTSKASPDYFVPYEVQLRNGAVKKWNLAMRRNETTSMWFVDGGY